MSRRVSRPGLVGVPAGLSVFRRVSRRGPVLRCPGVSRLVPGVRASRSEIFVCSHIPIRQSPLVAPCSVRVLLRNHSRIAQESFINHALIIHSGIIHESFKNHSSIIMNQTQIPSFSSPWPRGVSMVSPIPRLSLHLFSYPLFTYVLRTDNDDRHVHVHVCACVCMCMCMCMVI